MLADKQFSFQYVEKVFLSILYKYSYKVILADIQPPFFFFFFS